MDGSAISCKLCTLDIKIWKRLPCILCYIDSATSEFMRNCQCESKGDSHNLMVTATLFKPFARRLFQDNSC